MTHLGGFIVMGVKGIVHSDWLGAGPAVSPIGSQLAKEEIGKLGPPCTIEMSCGRLWQIFWTLPRQNCHKTHPPPPQLGNCLILQQIQERLIQTVYFSVLCHIY
jgi:hypothetical protein